MIEKFFAFVNTYYNDYPVTFFIPLFLSGRFCIFPIIPNAEKNFREPLRTPYGA